MSVVGLEASRIGDLAFDASIRLHELSNRTATLEEAFLEATSDSEEYQAHQANQPQLPARTTDGGTA